jgi:predicted permease
MLEQFWRDARYALRMMRRSPGFTIVAVLSLALGIGANTAIFSLIDTLMFRRLAVQDPGQLVELLQKYPGEPRGNGFWSRESFQHFRDHNHVFSALIASSGASPLSVRRNDSGQEAVHGEYVSADFFPALGLKAATGRLLGAEDSSAAVVSWSYWQSRFNLDPAILGKRIVVQDMPVIIVGVAPREFLGLQSASKTDIWLPLSTSESHQRLTLIGRLKRGVSIEQARAEMALLYQFTIEERASTSQDSLIRQLKIELEPAGAGLSNLRDVFAKPLSVLMTVVGLLLLITCANLAGLLLARGAARQKEMALRVSLGATRSRLMYQVLTESLLLSGTGGVLGVVFGYFGAGALVRILASGRQIVGLPAHLEIPVQIDSRVLLFTAAIALGAGVVFGLVPAWNAAVSGLRPARLNRIFGRSLVVSQVALSVILLSAAALCVRQLINLQHVDLGFTRDHVLLVTLDPSSSGYNNAQWSRSCRELLERLEQIPGVRSASLSDPTPLSGAGASGFVTAEGFQEKPEQRRYLAFAWIAPKYFETLGTPLLAGRDFNFQDQTRIAIVNQAMARHYFSSANPIGKQIKVDHLTGAKEERTYEVVGVVGDARYYDIREAPPQTIYLPAFLERAVSHHVVLRTNIDPAAVSADVRRTTLEVLKAVPEVTTLSDQVDASIVPERLIAALSGTFGVVGLLLVAIGIYGLLAFTVTRRTHEFGIRFALGATRTNVILMVLRDALIMVCVGLLVAAPMVLWGSMVAAMLIEDPAVNSMGPVAGAVLAILGCALLAAGIPARRAARVDPMVALRHE